LDSQGYLRTRYYSQFPLQELQRWNLLKFSIYTTAGASLWVTILALIGYFIGENRELIDRYLQNITISTLIVVALIITIYILKNRKK